MRISAIATKTVAAVAGVTTAAILTVTPAVAAPESVPFGQSAEITDNGGVIDYTVAKVQPSGHNDGIWYSEVTAKSVQGTVTPVIANFNARAGDSETYWVMKGNEVDGLPDTPIAQGTETTGRLYFDVRDGAAPDSVVYRDAAGVEKAIWKG